MDIYTEFSKAKLNTAKDIIESLAEKEIIDIIDEEKENTLHLSKSANKY